MKLSAILLGVLLTGFVQAGEWKSITLGQLDVEVYIPTKVASNGKRPLMVNLHGCAQSTQDLKRLGNWEKAADKYATVVALPKVPNGGVILGCWDYYGANHTERNRHSGYVFAMVQDILKMTGLKLDGKKVFVSGLSSGAGMAMVLACLNPELFKGVGVVAGPSVGTSSAQISYPATDAQTAARNCQKLAGDKSFNGQKASLAFGANDYIVSQQYSKINAQAFASVYGLQGEAEEIPRSRFMGANPHARGVVLRDRSKKVRLSYVEISGMGHAWPAGAGQSGNYIEGRSISYPDYLLGFLLKN